MRISDWSSDVCSSDLRHPAVPCPTPSGGWTGLIWFDEGGFQVVCRRDFRCAGKANAEPRSSALERPDGWPTDPEKKSTRAVLPRPEIGRASCRERVCQYV